MNSGGKRKEASQSPASALPGSIYSLISLFIFLKLVLLLPYDKLIAITVIGEDYPLWVAFPPDVQVVMISNLPRDELVIIESLFNQISVYSGKDLFLKTVRGPMAIDDAVLTPSGLGVRRGEKIEIDPSDICSNSSTYLPILCYRFYRKVWGDRCCCCCRYQKDLFRSSPPSGH